MDLTAQIEHACQIHGAGRLDEAQALYHAVLKKDPRNAFVQSQLALVFLQRGKTEQGLRFTEKALRLEPNQPYALNNRGVALYTLGRLDEALKSYDQSIALLPGFAEAHCNRGQTLSQMQRFDEALASLDHALRLDPLHARAYENRALALSALGRQEDALVSADRALGLNPSLHDAHTNRGNALYLLARYEEALSAYDSALALAPANATAHAMRANVLRDLGRLDEARASDERAMSLGGEVDYAAGARLNTKMAMCAWDGFAEEQRKLLALIARDRPAAVPFQLMALNATPALHLKTAALYASRWSGMGPRAARAPYRHDRIRIGYFSSDFYNHATSFLLAGLIDLHDRAQFEVTGISFGPSRDDPMRARLEQAFDVFVDAGSASDEDIAALAREREIDIAIDLKGYTQDARTGIFARGAAPVQASFLGYPGTMGADFIDYLIADPILIPEGERAFYTEKIAYLPDSYQPHDHKRAPATPALSRAALGLPESGFVFCCFNSTYKITPDVFDIWMRLLGGVEGSVLWLLEGNPWMGANLRHEAQKRGVTPERLVFAPRVEQADHMARQTHADLFLDTFYCNAHTTASDALWAGVPVLTRRGDTFVGRVAESLLAACGLHELVAADAGAYEALALALARDPARLAAVKARLAAAPKTQPLFDTIRFTKHIEAAYQQMHARAQSGQAPDHIIVQPIKTDG
jgi:predicted O-linked N-acetylglucosamine transferase (SPINDLY family)